MLENTCSLSTGTGTGGAIINSFNSFLHKIVSISSMKSVHERLFFSFVMELKSNNRKNETDSAFNVKVELTIKLSKSGSGWDHSSRPSTVNLALSIYHLTSLSFSLSQPYKYQA